MKVVATILKQQVGEITKSDGPIQCHYIIHPSGALLAAFPFMSDEHQCQYCRGTDHHTPFFDPNISMQRVWLCANLECIVYTQRSHWDDTNKSPVLKRAMDWKTFCDLYDLGSVCYKITFESINQAVAKIEYLKKFSQKPSSFIIMQGPSGSGKTYAAMGLCELFTRKNHNAILITQRDLQDKWLEQSRDSSNLERNNFFNRLKTVKLLVIDDFGLKEPSPAYMDFMQQLCDARSKWEDRGTVITTNLNEKTLAIYCGEALYDRVRTGQMFIFNQASRRENKPI